MTKKLSLFLLGGFLLLLLGCRHDLEQMDKVSTSESKAQKFSIFNFDKKTQRTPFDYAGAFAFLAQRYDSINHTNITGLVNTSNEVVYDSIKKQRFISSATEAYIEFRIHSQTVFEDNGDIWVVFPKIENNAVKELVVASLEEDETKVYYYRFDRFTDFHKENIEKFREVYAKYFHQAKSSSTGKMGVMSVCGTGVRPDCAIEEIVLPRPSKGGSKGGSGAWYGGDDGESAGGGGCGPHEMCAPPNGEGGGSYNPIPVNNTDPCANIKKSVVDNPKMKEPLKKLFEKSKQSGEQGFKVKADGTTTKMIDGGAHSVNLGDMTGYAGAYHNHTPNGIKMQSIPDIIGIFEQIVNRDINVDVSSVFAGMVGTEVCPSCADGYKRYNYVISFRGTEEEAKNLYQQYKNYDSKKDMIWYNEYAEMLSKIPQYRDEQVKYLNAAGLEKLFFDSLKKKNLDVNKFLLQRIDEKGNVSNISMENNASLFPNENPCN